MDFRRLSVLAHLQPEAACTVTSKACVLRALQTAHACACGPERWHDARWAGTASGWGAVRPARLARGASAGSTPGSRCLPPSSLRFLKALVVVRHVLGQRACINVAASRASRSTPCVQAGRETRGHGHTQPPATLGVCRLQATLVRLPAQTTGSLAPPPECALKIIHTTVHAYRLGYPRASGLPVVSCQP